MSFLEDRLRALNDQYKEAPVATGGKFELPPDGVYQAVVERFDTFETKKNELFLKTEMKVAFGEYAGRILEVVQSLENPERFDYLKKHLKTLGLDPNSFELTELFTKLNEVLDVPVEVAVVTSDKLDAEGNPYRNVYVNKRMGPPIRQDVERTGKSDLGQPELDFAPPVAAGPVDDDSDIPFLWDGPREFSDRYHAHH